MSKTYTITYASGVTEDVQMDLETVDEVSNQVFGLTMAAAAEVGCNVVLVGDFTPEPPDLTGTITAFSATNPTVASMDAEDQGVLTAGTLLTLDVLTGTDEASALLDGTTQTVLSVYPFVQLDIDLSAVDVTGLTADYDIEVPDVEEPETTPEGESTPGGGDGTVAPIGSVGGTDDPDTGSIGTGEATTGTPAPAPAPVEAPAPAPAPAPWASPTYTFTKISSDSPAWATIDKLDQLNQGDYLTFTFVEGSDEAKARCDGKTGQIQQINTDTLRVKVAAYLDHVDTSGLVMTAVKAGTDTQSSPLPDGVVVNEVEDPAP